MNLSCEIPKLDCINKPSKTDIDKLKAANIVPTALINSIFKDLEKDYKLLKKGTNTQSKRTKTKTKTKTGTKTGTKTMGTKTMRTKTRTKTLRKTYNMTGGTLTAYQKNKIADMVILLVAGSSYWFVVPMLETFIISVGILPKLCGQNIFEHIGSNMFAAEGQSCAARAQRYNTIMTGVISAITASAWYSKNQFTKENLSKNYNKVHRLVKKTIFGPSDTPSPEPSPVHSPPKVKVKTPSPKGKTSGRSRYQEQQYSQEREEEYGRGREEEYGRGRDQDPYQEQSRGYSPEETSRSRRR
jgi:hypothetical protein